MISIRRGRSAVWFVPIFSAPLAAYACSGDSSTGAAGDAGPRVPVRSERPLMGIPANADPFSFTFSDDLTRVAARVERDPDANPGEGPARVQVNDILGPEYDEVAFGSLTFSSDGSRFAYAARRGTAWFIVQDSVELGPIPGFGGSGFSFQSVISANPFMRTTTIPTNSVFLRFTADGSEIAYFERTAGKSTAVVGANREPQFDRHGGASPTFSGDGSRIAYTACTAGRCYAVVDHQQHGPFDGYAAGGVVFSPSGRSWALRIRNGREHRLLRDGREGRPYTGINHIIASEHGDEWAYVGRTPRGAEVVVGDSVIARHEDAWGLAFSRTTGKLAYAARGGDEQFIMFDRSKLPLPAAVGPGFTLPEEFRPAINPVDERIAYVVTYEDSARIVVDGRALPAYHRVYEPEWSPRGAHLVYAASVLDTVTVDSTAVRVMFVTDSVESERFDFVMRGTFSPDDARYVFQGWRNGQAFVVIDPVRMDTSSHLFFGYGPRFIDDRTVRFPVLAGCQTPVDRSSDVTKLDGCTITLVEYVF